MNNPYFSSPYFIFSIAHLLFEIYSVIKNRNRDKRSYYEIVGILITSSIFFLIPYSRQPEIDCTDIVNDNKNMILDTICNRPYIVNVVISLIPISFLFIKKGDKGEYLS
jgi:hypothetical protein